MPEDHTSIRILNKIIKRSREVLLYGARQRHAEICVDALGLDKGKFRSEVPGDTFAHEEEDDDLLTQRDFNMYQVFTARANNLT